MPRVSVCIPAYNGAKFLPSTLKSLQEQTFEDFEIVVVDDASPDNTRGVVEACGDPRVRYVRNPRNLGVPENLERALVLAGGEYIGVYEDHDLLDPDLLARSVALLDRDPTVAFVGTGIRHIDLENRTVAVYTLPWDEVLNGRWVARYLLTRLHSAFSVSSLIRRSALVQIERPWFDARYWWYADIHLWLRLAARFRVGYLREPLLSMRIRPPGHFLSDKHWQSLRIIDQLHADDWFLGFPDSGLASAIGRVLYALRRDRCGLWTLAMERARGAGSEVEEGVVALRDIATLPGQVLSRIIRHLPLDRMREPGRRVWSHMAKARRRRQQARAFGQRVE